MCKVSKRGVLICSFLTGRFRIAGVLPSNALYCVGTMGSRLFAECVAEENGYHSSNREEDEETKITKQVKQNRFGTSLCD